MIPVAQGELECRLSLRFGGGHHSKLAAVDFNHNEQTQVVQDRGNGRHNQDIKVRPAKKVCN